MDFDGGKRIPAMARLVGVVSAVPFWFAALLLWSRVDPVDPGRALALTIAYGAILLAFSGGIRWGTAIGAYGKRRQTGDMAKATLPAIAAVAAMFVPPVIGVSLLMAGFLLLALWDVTSVQSGLLPGWFASFRIMVTALSIPPLLAILGKVIHLLVA